MDFFSLDPRELPTLFLYRIQTPTSMASFSVSSDLVARDTQTIYTDCDDILNDFGGAVEEHLDLGSRRPSMFISLFAGQRHAENWALRYSNSHNGAVCTMYRISASHLAGLYVYHADELWRTLCLQVSQRVEASIADEYLVAHRIPSDAIVYCGDTDDIRQGEYLLSFKGGHLMKGGGEESVLTGLQNAKVLSAGSFRAALSEVESQAQIQPVMDIEYSPAMSPAQAMFKPSSYALPSVSNTPGDIHEAARSVCP